jgi:D-3-phosphoglycerate dehydrogenase
LVSKKILISDPLSQRGIAVFQEAGLEVDVKTGLSEDELVEIIGQYHGLVVRSQTKVTAKIIASGKNLKVIGRAGVGVDNVDLEAATEHGVIVLNAPSGNTISTAEHTVAMMLALSRNIPQAHRSMQEGRWDRKKYTGVELNGKVLGIIGLGRVGSEVAKRAQSFGMRILAFDPYLAEERARDLGIQLATVEEILPIADFITVHTPLTPKTRNLISDDEFAKMKDTVRIINCARGGIIDYDALARAVKAGKVAGAALDVYEQEPPENLPLRELPEVILTPHLGASTAEAQINVAVDVAKEMVRALKGKAFKNAVNMTPLRPELLAQLEPYLDLAQRLGSMAAQLSPGGIGRIEVTYSGELGEMEVAPLTTSLLMGVLRPPYGDEVNMVNAGYLAKKRGITVKEIRADSPEDYTNLISITTHSAKGTHQLAGSLFARNEARVVQVEGYHVDVIPQGYLLMINHHDRPGIIGEVGTLLGKAGINIATMQVGRREIGGDAVMILSIDSQLSAELLAKIGEIQGIRDARLVNV